MAKKVERCSHLKGLLNWNLLAVWLIGEGFGKVISSTRGGIELSLHGVHIAYVELPQLVHLPPLPAEVVLAILFLVRFLLNGDGKVAVV